MPNAPREENRHRSVRVELIRWEAAERATAVMGSDRSKVINAFLAWYMREPGAKLPERPPADWREQAQTGAS